MEISIIVPFSDSKSYLRDCVQSLQSQLRQFHDAEVIFADAGSADGTLESLRDGYPEFSVVSSPTRNPYVARNLAARSAKGRVLAFTDADCCVASRWLQAIHEGVSAGADLVTGPVVPPAGASIAVQQVHEYENSRMEEMCSRSPLGVAYAYTNNLAIDAKLFRLLGGFRETKERGGDTEFVLRALRSGTSSGLVYQRDMRVVHLEIASLPFWWRKKFLYGRSAAAGKSVPSPAAIQAGASGVRVRLICALLVGRVCYSIGRLLAQRRSA